jgi:DNA-binding CsgD family transcriptional regulator
MHFAVRDQRGRVGDVRALMRVTRSSLENSGGDISDSITKKRRLVAMFCKMLGDQSREQTGDGSAAVEVPAMEPLSPRERQTLDLLLIGNAEKEIANRLAISRHTVHVYVKSIYKRFGVCSRGELLARWVQR